MKESEFWKVTGYYSDFHGSDSLSKRHTFKEENSY